MQVYPTFALDVRLRRNVAKSQQMWGPPDLLAFNW